jgi:hypothetical protein
MASAEATLTEVRARLEAAAIVADDEEVAEFVRLFLSQKALTEVLYTVDAARYAEPALLFAAAAVDVPWAEPDAQADADAQYRSRPNE